MFVFSPYVTVNAQIMIIAKEKFSSTAAAHDMVECVISSFRVY